MNELDAYDSIGMEYYYLKDIDRARYYHNRMMNNELEKVTSAKANSLDKLKKARKENAYKKSFGAKSIFEKYCDEDTDFKHLHKNIEEIKVLEMKLAQKSNKELLESPRYEGVDFKDRVLKKALQKILQNPAEELDELRKVNAKPYEGRRQRNSSLQIENQRNSEQKGLFSNLKVAILANQ